MGMIVSAEGEFKPTPAGTHLAICTGYIDLGTQTADYGPVDGKKSQRKIRITWELCELTRDDGKPTTTGKSYTNNNGDKTKLREHLQSWRGRPFTPAELEKFDLDNILGKPCMITIVHQPKRGGGTGMSESISAITTVYKGVPIPAQVSPMVTFEIAKWDDAKFDALPAFIQKWILASPEGAKARSQAHPGQSGMQAQDPDGIGADSIPF